MIRNLDFNKSCNKFFRRRVFDVLSYVPSQIIKCLGPGDIIVVTRSGGRGSSDVQFRVFIEQIGPFQESNVWVDESKTFSVRNIAHNIPEIDLTIENALRLNTNLLVTFKYNKYLHFKRLVPKLKF